MNARSLFLVFTVLSLSSCVGMGSRSPAPVVRHGQNSGAGTAGMHNVISGDTVYSISTRYRLPMRDIVLLNHLKPPFKLTEGQRIKLPPPQEYKVQYGDTLYEVSRMFGVNSSEVAKLNNIQSPYVVRTGQVLRLPSVVRQASKKPMTVAAMNSSDIQSAALPSVEKSELSGRDQMYTPSVVNEDGLPIPQAKPFEESMTTEPVHVAKVTSKVPKRASSKFLKPVNGKIISNYGAKKSGLHNDGINIAAARGANVHSAENGVVVYAGNAIKGSGNLILVRHEDQWMTAYGHLDSVSVREGQIIKRGAVIGKVGSTGSVSTPQLHFEVRRGTDAMNPTKYME